MSIDPLALTPKWGREPHDQIDSAPLISLEKALEQSSLRRGIPREQFLRELLQDLNQYRLIPLLWMLPKGWRKHSAVVPERLRALASILEEGLLSPLLLATFADDLQHLIPASKEKQSHPLSRWKAIKVDLGVESSSELTSDLTSTRELVEKITQQMPRVKESINPIKTTKFGSLGGGITWENIGLPMLQSASAQVLNQVMAQVLNALAANRLPKELRGRDIYTFEGVSSGAELINHLINRGWQCKGRIRASVASFGLGACQNDTANGWRQIPLAVPYRTGLEDDQENELMALLPHSSFELELKSADGEMILIQYYQGTEGLNGWAALNDLHRPWQNDRHNGSVAYPGSPFKGEDLSIAINISELMGAVHNWMANMQNLHIGGYGALGFCIDSTALLSQAVTGSSMLYPLTLGGLWRERLAHSLSTLLQHGLMIETDTVDRYKSALIELPQDLYLQGQSRTEAFKRLINSQPIHSPFELVRCLNGENESLAKTLNH